MQITIEIPDSVAAYAAQQGMSPETYAERAVVEWMPPTETRIPLDKLMSDRAQLPGSPEAFVQSISRFSGKLPVLPPEAFTRESFYSDDE